MILRIIAGAVLLISILFLPFWLPVILALIAMLYFRVYWEGVALFLLSDLIYGTPEAKFWGLTYVSFIMAVIAIVLIEFLKRKLKFYPQI
ncbi:MAG: hypothetical protein V4486_01465 [Patescibacteria group bacterium]